MTYVIIKKRDTTSSHINDQQMTSFRRIIIRSLLYGENHDKDIEKMAKAGQSAWETIVP